MENEQFEIDWLDFFREPKEKSDPDYPHGIDLNIAMGRSPSCKVDLPYPAKRCGVYHVLCKRCGMDIVLTTAGRPDDPRSVRFPCKLPLN